MIDKHILSNGWAQATFMVVVLWGLINVIFRYSSSVLGVNFIIFTCCLFLSSSLVLLLVGGKGGLGKETMRSIDTWVYGIVLLLLYILNLYLFSLITSTEGTLLQRLSIVVSLLLGWLFLGRKIGLLQALGAFTVFGGVLMICSGAAAETRSVLYMLIFASGVLQAVQIFAAEFHKAHKHAAEVKGGSLAKCRVVGFVMFVTSTLFLSLMFILALTQGVDATENMVMKDLPVLKDFMHTESILYGMVVGVIIVAPMKVLEFSSAQKINTHNFLAVCCLAPAGTLFWEWATSSFTGLSLRAFTQMDVIAGVAITLGGLLVAFGGIRSKKKQPDYTEHLVCETQDIALVEDCREIVANTLEHFDSDLKKSATALGVPRSVLTAFLEDKDKVLAFKNFPEVGRAYRKNIAMADGLTGLANRSAFMTALRSAAYEVDVYSVIYIDLDKFKPVNDTYGHEAGDKVLQGVAARLQEVAPPNAVITRMGGDEYCMLLLDVSKQEAEKLLPKVQDIIVQPFELEGIADKIEVSASVGLATYPEDGDDPEVLLKIADEGMFGAKKSRE